MNLFFQFIFLFSLLTCNNNSQQASNTSDKDSDSLSNQGKFCNSSISFVDSSTTYIKVDVDTVGNLKSMSDYFDCIKQHLKDNSLLKKAFISNSKHIYFELSSSALMKLTDVNLELINYSDTSMFWTGHMDDKSRREGFFEFIAKSGYTRKWEQALSEILGKDYKWKYGAENIFYMRGTELSGMQQRKYKKEIYPHSFELYMTRE